MVTPGDVLADRYRIDAPLGGGGMASVFRAQDLRLGRAVAVKVLQPHLADDPTVVTRFEREARALAAVRHPNVIGVHDVEVADAAAGRPPFIVLELADGGTLADRLRASGTIAPRELASLVTAVAGGLAAIHAAGLVHRDVKPANVLFADDVPKVGDLGIARWAEPSAATTEAAALTTDGGILGTLRYVPPEALAGSSPGPAGDVFGLAALAFEALTGRPVRPGTTLATIAADATMAAPPPSAVAPGLGTAFDALFAAALSADPAERPDAVTFADRLATAATIAPAAAMAGPDDDTIVQAVARPSSSAIHPGRPAAPPITAGTRPRARPAPRAGHPARRRLGVPLLLLGAAALALTAMVVAFANAGRDGGGTGVPTPGTSPTIAASSSPSTSPSPSASASPMPTASPAPTPEPTRDPALDAIDDLRAAIANARGGQGGLKNPEARDLDGRLDRIIIEVTNGDRETARRLAIDLRGRIEKLKVPGDAGDRLEAAAAALVQTLGGD